MPSTTRTCRPGLLVGPTEVDARLKPDFAAPGVEMAAAAAIGSALETVATPVADGDTGMSGTSTATPVVAGAAALMVQQNPEWSGEQLKAALVGSAAEVEGTPRQAPAGWTWRVRWTGR
ncbi:S8 family serine peptidase [Streptomyces spiramenti]|uniref:S8 family serine peptidase n=1 Tax=Streptomyces spiramenti TaxID=2720606 RepID=A0ABX1AEX4_9ACTN|nr:S8 family serine peptidase [Streptomyces spiramenti]